MPERILGLSKLTERRLFNASRFLNTHLSAAFIDGQELSEDYITQSLDSYKQDNPEYSDFTLGEVWVTSLSQLSESVIAGIENGDVPDDIDLDLSIFRALDKLSMDITILKLLEDMHMPS